MALMAGLGAAMILLFAGALSVLNPTQTEAEALTALAKDENAESAMYFVLSWFCAGAISFIIGFRKEECRWDFRAQESLIVAVFVQFVDHVEYICTQKKTITLARVLALVACTPI